MKKIGIMTIYDENNYGNRLQNYAVQTVLRKRGFDVETIRYNMEYTLSVVKPGKRLDCFHEFNKNINFAPDELIMNQDSIIKEDVNDRYDYVVIGSDQIWNYSYKALFSDKIFGCFVDKEKRISLSASIGVSFLPQIPERYEISKKYFSEMNGISVREFAGKELIKQICGREDVEVLVDPTMLLTKEEWSSISLKPYEIEDGENFILKYFLGESEEDNKILNEFAKKHNCKIIDIGDSSSKYYNIGPSEFLYLEKNAKLVVTDSFHSCVFALLFNTPLVMYKRNEIGENDMYSRMETLIKKFDLKDMEYKGKLDDNIFNVNKEKIEKFLDIEREKADKYLERFLKND